MTRTSGRIQNLERAGPQNLEHAGWCQSQFKNTALTLVYLLLAEPSQRFSNFPIATPLLQAPKPHPSLSHSFGLWASSQYPFGKISSGLDQTIPNLKVAYVLDMMAKS
jgi:hypothetical protein